MLNETTINKLNDMHLRSMADSLREQMKSPSFATLSFEERFGLIIDAEWARRKNKQLDRLIKKAPLNFPSRAWKISSITQTDIWIKLKFYVYLPAIIFMKNTMLSSWVHRELEKLISVVHWGSQPVEISSAQSIFVCQSY